MTRILSVLVEVDTVCWLRWIQSVLVDADTVCWLRWILSVLVDADAVLVEVDTVCVG